MGTGAAHQHPKPGWLQPQRDHARGDPSRGAYLTGRPKPTLARSSGSRQRLDAFREQRGEEVYCCAEAFGYVHRSRYRTPITSSRVSATAVSVWVSPGSTKV